MENSKSIIIIGGGIAGLSAGCYGQINGYRTMIFEKNEMAGGVCTSWKRGDYIINGCLYWLVGSGPGSVIHDYWNELDALADQTIINHDRFIEVENINGEDLILYADVNRLEEHLLALAPEDKEVISTLISDIRFASTHEMPENKPEELYTLSDGFNLLVSKYSVLRKFLNWSKLSMREFCAQFKSPLIRNGLISVWDTEMPYAIFILTQAWLNNKTAGYVLGGSTVFERGIEYKYSELGGELHLNSPVERILIENGITTGVRLKNGVEYHADYVISAADGYTTLFKMIGENYIDNKIKDYYKNLKLFKPILFASFGVNQTFPTFNASSMGHSFPLRKSISIAGQKIDRMVFQVYNFDPALAPEGRTLITTILETDYDFWNELYKDKDIYNNAKEKVTADLTDALEQRFPGISSAIEMKDLSTPITYQQFSGCYRGAYEGWMISVDSVGIRMKKTLRHLKNFYMAGQWVEPGGGLPTALMSGRNAIRLICHKDDKEFSGLIKSEMLIHQ
jgi:phytoene dehydrogenase-like protein